MKKKKHLTVINNKPTSEHVTSRLSQTLPFTRLEGVFLKFQQISWQFFSLPSPLAPSLIVFYFVLGSAFARLNLLL